MDLIVFSFEYKNIDEKYFYKRNFSESFDFEEQDFKTEKIKPKLILFICLKICL